MTTGSVTPIDKSGFGAYVNLSVEGQVFDGSFSKFLLDALESHSVLVLKESALKSETFVGLAASMGNLEILPEAEKRNTEFPAIFDLTNVGEDGHIVQFDEPQSVFLRGTERWHTDSSFREIPCLCTLLNAVEVPEQGGNTLFADMRAAYEAIPEDLKLIVDSLKVVHSYAYSRANNPGKLEEMSQAELAKYPPTTHPLIRTHADGSRSFYMGGHASHIEGMPVDEGRNLLSELLEISTQKQFVYSHQWSPGDLVIWDNRSTLHRLEPYDIAGHRRIMRRITVKGTEIVR
jgi:alpha-ketoglutarate-dependent 2,4-dichlorophenoxyacetate dioxygenase